MTDETSQLVSRCLKQDELAMRQLMDRYLPRVFALCFRMLAHRQDAEDASQETFVRVFRSLRTWDSTRDFEPWLLAIAGNRCRTRIARRGSRPKSVDLEGFEVATDHNPQQEARHLEEEVQLALSSVTPRYSEAFQYFHTHGMSYAQIAEVMEIPLGTVKTWVRRARMQLIAQLQMRGAVEGSPHEMRDV